MSDNLDAQPGGRLLKLPAEVRLLIYEQLFPPCKIDIHAPRGASWDIDSDIYTKTVDVAILKTCRTICAEAAPVLHENTEFGVSFACSGRDLRTMKGRKHKVYAQLLEDLQGRVRSLFSLARKVSLTVLFADSNGWEKPERKWFRELTSELARLDKAPKLKQLHITFEEDECSRPSIWDHARIRKQFKHVLGVLGQTKCRAAVTAAVHPTLSETDVKLSKYFDTLAKLSWVDTTHEVYSQRLERLTTRRAHLQQEIRSKREWLATQDPESLDELYQDRRQRPHSCAIDLTQMDQGTDRSINLALAQIQKWEWEHEGMHMEIASIEAHLKWVAKGRSAHAKRY